MAICPFISGVVLPQGQTIALEALVDCKQSQCQIWDTKTNGCGAKVSPTVPDVNWLRTVWGQYYNTTQMGSLLNEFMFQTDIDGNGKIYGKDFRLSDPPPGLAGIVGSEGFDSNAPTMTMAEYLESVNQS